MLSSGRGQDGGGAVGSLDAHASIEQRIQRWVNLVDQGAPTEQIQEAEKSVAEALREHRFEIRQSFPFFQKLVKKFGAHRAFQQFQLPGRDRMVMDRREQFAGEPKQAAQDAAKEGAKEATKEAAKSAAEAAKKGADGEKRSTHFTLQQGKLVEKKKPEYVNHLAVREAPRGGTEKPATGEGLERMLSAFEKLIVQRFEEGKQIAQKSEDGRAHFLEKSESEWKTFFRAFLGRTVKKKVLLAEIQEFLLRGVVQKGSKGIFIGDMKLQSGRVEKFIRFSILAEALAKLKTMMPGEAISKGMLEGLTGEELMYLALAASRGREFVMSRKPTEGKFVGGRAEAQAAEALGLPIQAQLERRARQMRRGKGGGLPGGNFFGKDGEPEETPYRFVPWWSWGNLSSPQPSRWITRVFYGTLFIISVIGVVAMTLRLLKGV